MENTFYQTKEAFLKFFKALVTRREWRNATYYTALNFLDDMSAIAWKDAEYMADFIDWLNGKGTQDLQLLLRSVVRYNPTILIHFNAFDLLDTTSLHFNTKINQA